MTLPSPCESPVVLVSGDFVRTGGMDRANFALASYLLGLGREVHLVANRVDPELLIKAGAVFHRVPRPLNTYLLAEPLLRRAGYRWAKELSDLGPRVVVNGGNCYWGDINWVHYVHAAWRSPHPGNFVRRLKGLYTHRSAVAAEARSLRNARVVIANSERTRRDVIEKVGVPEDRVHTVYYGVDATRFRPPTGEERRSARVRLGWDDDRPTLVFVGALGDRRKGLDLLLGAWRLLKASGKWDARLAVVGAGAQLDHFRVDAQDLGGRVEFLGFRKDVPEILAACDGLVSPARYEAYGLNVHEALCCGLPAIVSRSAGVAERYPTELQALLIPDPPSLEGLVHCLRAWQSERQSFARDLAALATNLRENTWERMSEQFLKVTGMGT